MARQCDQCGSPTRSDEPCRNPISAADMEALTLLAKIGTIQGNYGGLAGLADRHPNLAIREADTYTITHAGRGVIYRRIKR
jgi:hypothetical protein